MSPLFLVLNVGHASVSRFFHRTALIALSAATAFSFPAVAAPLVNAPLTLTGAQHLAIERSRQLIANESAAAASRNMALAAGQLPDPMVKFGIDNLPIDGADRFSVTGDFMTMRRAGVAQEFTRSEKRRLRAERFEHEAEKSLLQKAATTAEIQRNTALAWLDRYYAEATVRVIAEQILEANAEVSAAEGAYRAGRGSQADIFAAKSARIALDDRTSEFNRRVRAAKISLDRWIGDAANTPLTGRPAIESISLGNNVPLDTHIASHPEIVLLSKQEEIASTEARLAEANKKSDWSVELMYSQRGSAFSNMISIGVSIPLQWDQRNRQDREVAARRATIEEARAQRDELLRGHVAEVRKMIDEWENGHERLARYERELIPLAGERTAAALAGYRGGKTNLNEVLLARRGEIDVRLQALELEADTARLWAQLNFLIPEGGNTQRLYSTTRPAVFSAKEIQ